MKNTFNNPYATMSFGKIDAPKKKAQPEPKASKKTGAGDLRSGGKK